MSRNARFFEHKPRRSCWMVCLWLALTSLGQTPGGNDSFSQSNIALKARVVITHDPQATAAFQPRSEIVRGMVDRGITSLTGKATPALAWLSLITTQDVIGIKVFSAPGPDSGTRPAVVEAVVEGLLQAKVPPRNIIIWDKHRADLRRAGFFQMAARYGLRVEGSAAAGYDEGTFYEPLWPLLGQLVWGDVEFGRKGEGIGRKSYVSKLVSGQMTKIINITPLLNHNTAGVSGNLYSLAVASVDNTLRFERDFRHLNKAVPEIYALPVLGDRVVLSIVDALICQYEGEHQSLLHYSTALNELRFSTDPVALDVLSLQELERHRQGLKSSSITNFMELYQNASELVIGVSDPNEMQVERVR